MTAAPVQLGQRDIADAQRIVGAVGDAFSAKVVGQQNLRESLLIGLLTGGHILIESVPGLAKTTAARVIAESIHGGFQRIQCTPDLLPSDIIGTQIYDSATNSFVTQLGPVHTNIVLLDEINRSSAKTQSAMLEAMEERQTTIAGTVYPIPEPFLVIATQNPVDQEGTYPLSEAQTDRFMLKDVLSYPSPDEEVEVMDRMDAGLYDKDHRSRPVVGLDDVRRLQDIVRHVHMDRALMRYASELVAVTRDTRRSSCPANLPGSSNTAPARAPPSRSARRRARWRCCPAAATSFPTTSPNSPTACCGTGSSSASRRPATASPPKSSSTPCCKRSGCRRGRRGQAPQQGEVAFRHRHPRPAGRWPLRAAAQPQPGVRRPAALRARRRRPRHRLEGLRPFGQRADQALRRREAPQDPARRRCRPQHDRAGAERGGESRCRRQHPRRLRADHPRARRPDRHGLRRRPRLCQHPPRPRRNPHREHAAPVLRPHVGATRAQATSRANWIMWQRITATRC